MLGGIRLKVVYGQEKTCFVYISQKYCTNSDQSQCIQVISTDKKVLLWVVYSSNIPEGQIACNPIYCKILGLEEGSYVFVCPYGDVKILDELFIDTDSPDDQEILERNVETLQLRILDQLRFVAAHQKAIVWISSSMPITFTPKKTGLLVNHSRVVVKIDAFNNYYESLQSTFTETPPKDIIFNNIGIINQALLKPYTNVPTKLVLRAHPIDSDGKKNLVHPYTVFIHEDYINEKYKDLTIILAKMANIPKVQGENGEDDDEESIIQINDLCVEIVPINNIVYQSLCQEFYNKNIPTVLIPKSLNNIVNIENGSRIAFTIIGDEVEQPENVEIIFYTKDSKHEDEIVEKFKEFVIESTHSGKKFLINHGMVKQNYQLCNGHIKINLKPDKLKYTMLNSLSFRSCTVTAKCLPESDLNLAKPSLSMYYDYTYYCRSMQSIQELIEKVISHLYFEIHREAVFKGISEIKSNVLVTGLSGTGKTAICKLIQKDLSVSSNILHCRSLKGRKDITEVVAKAILMSQEHSPAVLICDDIDSLVPCELEGASPSDIAYYQRLAVTIKNMLQNCSGVCVLMTALSLKHLHPLLAQFAGKPLFTAHFAIPELQKDERMELLTHLINDKICTEFTIDEDDVIKMAMDTAGGNVRDVTDYFHKQIFKAVKKKNASPECVTPPRLVESITKDVEKANEFDIWGPVGGLDSVKQQLTECIFWPIMYSSLFKSQSCGVLLYGPPGCGKSHIGSCLAGLTNMELILVKGPELLSKYIGQSEKAVRDVFDKADMKRPCILFFDEFDSLAPKRGHDSTGVTDRVVNQLLARLDGAEGGARGPVLAASARPDLLDPALLRAGRLHTHLYCAPPDSQEDRYSILRKLSKDVSLSEDVDLQDIAARTAGFSPADLKSLLVTAQLSKLEKQLAESEDKNMESVVVSREDLDNALLETKPSMSPEQRLFYDTIYKRFRGEKLSNEEKLIENVMQKQRVTLA